MAPDVDPHVVGRGHEIRIAREPEARDVEIRRCKLIGDGDVHVPDFDEVADVVVTCATESVNVPELPSLSPSPE